MSNRRRGECVSTAPCDHGPLVIGLTGPIASGKSTVAALLRERGAEVIDADQVYHSLLSPGSDLWRRITATFGSGVVSEGGDIDRAALGKIVFADADALADLDRLTHPAVVAEIRQRLSRSSARVVAIEAIKLVQAGLTDDIDSLWLVTADPQVRLARLMARSGIDATEAKRRMAASPIPTSSGARFDVVIDNSGDVTATARQVARAWQSRVPRPQRVGRVAKTP